MKDKRLEEEITHKAAEFLNKEANRNVMITVTRALTAKDIRKIEVLVTVFPPEKETVALAFLKRKRSEFRDFLKKQTRLKVVPMIDFKIDFGEKNRLRLEDISKEH